MKITFSRLFTQYAYKGTKNYLKTQRKYEIARTVIYFFISFSLLIGGILSTGTRANLLTIVAVLGCLPASKSLVSAVMYCRYKGMDITKADETEQKANPLNQLFDMVFTSYEKTYVIHHMVIKGNSICGYSADPKFEETPFYSHIQNMLRGDGIKDVSIKIFKDYPKYINRIAELKELNCEENNTLAICNSLKNVSL